MTAVATRDQSVVQSSASPALMLPGGDAMTDTSANGMSTIDQCT